MSEAYCNAHPSETSQSALSTGFRRQMQSLPDNQLARYEIALRLPPRDFCSAAQMLDGPPHPRHALTHSVQIEGRHTCAVCSERSKLERMGTPSLFTITVPITPLWELMRLSVSSTSDCEGRGQMQRGEPSGPIG